MFCAILGGVAGDLALLYGARGGVSWPGAFRPASRNPSCVAVPGAVRGEGAVRAWLAPVPAWLVVRPNPAMLGLAALARWQPS